MIEHILTYFWNKLKESVFKYENRPTPQIERKCIQVSTLTNFENVQILCDENDETFTIISLNGKHRIEINSVGYENIIEAIELSVFQPYAMLISNLPMAFN
jgi:hypothetical protein